MAVTSRMKVMVDLSVAADGDLAGLLADDTLDQAASTTARIGETSFPKR